MRLVYSILLLITIYINTVTACKDCCKDQQPLECAYKTPEERKTSPLCACKPSVALPDGTITEMSCAMSIRRYTTNGKFTPCRGFYDSTCNVTNVEIKCYHGYPPSSAVYGGTSDYCEFEENEKPSDIYNIFFTCWLYDCEQRLKKPEKAVKRGTLEMSWCYPPMVKDPSLKYCDKYTLGANDTEVFYDYSATQKQLLPKKKRLCVLLPFCAANGIVDSAFMPTNYNNDGKANEKHCERLCRGDGDNNGTEDGEPCRVIPSCLFQNGTNEPNIPDPMYNKFLVHECLPWCTVEDSYVRSSSRALRTNQYPGLSDKRCNRLPFCVDNKAPEPKYGPTNPYAADKCIEPKTCAVKESPTTHYCSVATTGDGGGVKAAGMGKGTIIGICVGAGLLLLILLVIAAIFVWRNWDYWTREKSVIDSKIYMGPESPPKTPKTPRTGGTRTETKKSRKESNKGSTKKGTNRGGSTKKGGKAPNGSKDSKENESKEQMSKEKEDQGGAKDQPGPRRKYTAPPLCPPKANRPNVAPKPLEPGEFYKTPENGWTVGPDGIRVKKTISYFKYDPTKKITKFYAQPDEDNPNDHIYETLDPAGRPDLYPVENSDQDDGNPKPPPTPDPPKPKPEPEKPKPEPAKSKPRPKPAPPTPSATKKKKFLGLF